MIEPIANYCKPVDEEDRLRALLDLDILDSEPEKVFDDFTWLAKEIAQVPICLISLVDAERQWFKSKQGLEADQTPRGISFCTHAIMNDEPLVVEDANLDHRFQSNPLVRGELGIRFYLGIPLRTKRGFLIGTLCLIDQKPRSLEQHVIEKIEVIARRVVGELENRRVRHKQKRLLEESLGAQSMNDETAGELFPCIRQPLAAILDSTNFLLESDQYDRDQKGDLLAIHQSTRQLFEYFDTMLLDPKTGYFISRSNYETLNVSHAIQNALDMYSVILKHRNIKVCIDRCASVPQYLQVDVAACQQILMVMLDEALTADLDRIELSLEIPTQYQSPHLLNIMIRLHSSSGDVSPQRKALSFLNSKGTRHLRELKLNFLKKKLNSIGGFFLDHLFEKSEMTALIPIIPRQSNVRKSSEWLHFSVGYFSRDPIAEVMLTRYLTQMGHKVILSNTMEQLINDFLDNSYDCLFLDSSLSREDLISIVAKLNAFQSSLKMKTPFIGVAADSKGKAFFNSLGLNRVLLKPLDRDSLKTALYETV
jgi:hypothetical protein